MGPRKATTKRLRVDASSSASTQSETLTRILPGPANRKVYEQYGQFKL